MEKILLRKIFFEENIFLFLNLKKKFFFGKIFFGKIFFKKNLRKIFGKKFFKKNFDLHITLARVHPVQISSHLDY